MFFAHLVTQMYNLEVDAIYICGDFNCRIADKADGIEGLDNIPPRVALYLVCNSHGDSFLDFLRDSKCCILNGRLNVNDDHFTSVSVRGKAVVDYVVTPHTCLEFCVDVKVITATDLLNKNAVACLPLIGDRCRLPDHSLIHSIFKVDTQLTNENNSSCVPKRRHGPFPETFLTSTSCQMAVQGLENKLGLCHNTQEDVDKWYEDFCEFIRGEINSCKNSISNKKHFKRGVKPFWNVHLQKLWNERTIAEREFLKCKAPQNKQDLRENYKQKQSLFGKYVRFYKRRFNRGQALKLEHLQTSNPQQFWKEINKLGPYRIKTIPMEVVMENGAVELRKE